jgi:predicted TIM-barrel fold metal-dependent hydrolase
MVNYKVISSDDHVYEPADLWTGRIGAKFGDQCPRVIREEGADWWYCDGEKILSCEGGGEQLGLRFTAPEKLSRGGVSEDVRPGAYLPEDRIKDMDIDGLEGTVIYPTIGVALGRVEDATLMSAICGAYNDWMAEFCKPFPHILKGIAMLNMSSVPVAVKEMERCANLGLAGALIPVYPPEERGYDSPEYEPLWAAAQDLGMPLSLHINTRLLLINSGYQGGHAHELSGEIRETASFRSNVDHWVRMSFANMIFSGVFERYPKLTVGSIEMDLSWAAHFLEKMDFIYTQRAIPEHWYSFMEGALPSDYFHRNGFISFQEDAAGVRLRDLIGVDNLLWGSDYPHPESTFPETQQILKNILAGCSEEDTTKIVRDNTARVYGFNSP